MKKILDLITDEVTKAFTECGYDAKYAKVTLSNRPDLCEYQCNGAKWWKNLLQTRFLRRQNL